MPPLWYPVRMKGLLFIFSIFSFISLSLHAQDVYVITIEDQIITPVTVEYITRALEIAEENQNILIIQLDTPGGLLKSTQQIVKLLLNTSIPIITYVTPSGAKAASAGVFISYASHIFAMSPSTRLGSAHPVIGGGSWGKLPDEVKEKVLNDTLAWAENIAVERKRSVEFIKEAITESTSITEKEALERTVCDVIAQDLNELLEKIDGMVIELKSGTHMVATHNVTLTHIPLTQKERFFNALLEPNIAYLLLTLGFLGLIFEVTHPGFGFPGIAGLICLIFSFYALSILPVNYAGVALIILGIIFFIVEAFTPTFGMFTLGGIISLFLGSLMLFNQPRILKVSFTAILPTLLFFSGLSIFFLTRTVAVQRKKSMTGTSGLLGKTGIAHTDIVKEGKVFIHGELWNAYTLQEIKKGEKVVVEKIEGLTLLVKKKEEQ